MVPLVVESRSWANGVFMGASISSETTAASKGVVGKLRHDPFSMLPFCGYNMGDYFAHWLDMGTKTSPGKLPKIYSVNWFGKDANGAYIWPGFGENSRVLKWVFERCSSTTSAKETPIGLVPENLDLTGLSVDAEALFKIDNDLWRKEADEIEQYFKLFGPTLPEELSEELNLLRSRLNYM